MISLFHLPQGAVGWERNLVEEFGSVDARHGLAASVEQSDSAAFIWVERSEEPYVLVSVWATPIAIGEEIAKSACGRFAELNTKLRQKGWKSMSVRRTNSSPAWTAYASGDLTEALASADAAIRADENDGRAWEVRGLVLRDLNQPIDAADAIERASLLVTICLEARIALAQCYGTLRRRRLARELYLELIENNELSVTLLLEVAAGLDAVDEPKLAMEICRRAGWRDPDAAQVYYDMAFYATRCGCRSRVAESLVWHAIDLDPANVHYRVGLASLLTRLGRPGEAHRVVQSLSTQQIAAITCRCCLERLGELFAQAGDAERRTLCRRRWLELAASTNAASQSDAR